MYVRDPTAEMTTKARNEKAQQPGGPPREGFHISHLLPAARLTSGFAGLASSDRPGFAPAEERASFILSSLLALRVKPGLIK